MENKNITEIATETKVQKNKRYFWIKLMENFFNDKYIRFLKQHPEGYRIICIYLMLQLKATQADGVIEYENLLSDYVTSDFANEIAVSIGEPLDIVKNAIDILEKFGFLVVMEDKTVQMIEKPEIVDYGKPGESTKRVEKYRNRKKQQAQREEM